MLPNSQNLKKRLSQQRALQGWLVLLSHKSWLPVSQIVCTYWSFNSLWVKWGVLILYMSESICSSSYCSAFLGSSLSSKDFYLENWHFYSDGNVASKTILWGHNWVPKCVKLLGLYIILMLSGWGILDFEFYKFTGFLLSTLSVSCILWLAYGKVITFFNYTWWCLLFCSFLH